MNTDFLRSLTPEKYLAAGYRDDRGAPRPELTALWAVAALEQLKAAGATPAMLEGALAQLKPVALAQASHGVGAPDVMTLRAALQDQPKAVRGWLGALLDQAKGRADLRPLLAHAAQVLSLLALVQVTPKSRA